MEHGVRTPWGITLFENVERRFLPELRHLPLFTFDAPQLPDVWSGKPLNVCEQLLDTTVATWGPDRLAIVTASRDGGERWTYGRLLRDVSRLASGLAAAGLQPGDRVLLRLPDVPQAAIAQLAVWRIGAIVVPSSVLEMARELTFMLNDTETGTVICDSTYAEELEKALPSTPHVRRVIGCPESVAGGPTLDTLSNCQPNQFAPHASRPFDASGIYYTGGTTGLPKGCLHTHAGEIAVADLNGWARGATSDSVFLTHAPIGHAYGNGEKINFPFRLGATAVYVNGPTPEEMWSTLAEHRVTTLAGAATMYRMMLADPPDADLLANLVLTGAVSSGEVLNQSTAERWAQLVHCPLRNTVGMTPMRHLFIDSNIAGVKTAPDVSVGSPLPGYEARVLTKDNRAASDEPGRLAIRGPTGITYWTNQHPRVLDSASEDVQDGWSLLDDAYLRDEYGWLWFHGRLDDMIVTGGRQVAPIEVETALSTHSYIAEACVVSAPDPVRGQVVAAFVQLHDGIQPGSEVATELQDHAKATMAPYKYPRRIEFVDKLPKDAVGKIQRRSLRERLLTEQETKH